jgi:polar amino acid transport system substrate-binding protein
MRIVSTLLLTAAVTAVAGCGAGEYQATPVPGKQPVSQAPATPAAPEPQCGNPVASYAPTEDLPPEGHMPGGTFMADIQRRGRLIAGVSADTLLLGARNPVTGTIEGFDIDLLKAISQAIFGRPDRIELKVISAADRIPALQKGQVDIVARNMTITCSRWQQIAFSSEYYPGGQKVLVKRGQAPRGLPDLSGKPVCAPAASTSLDNLEKFFPQVQRVPATNHTGCLVLFQQGKVEAISGDSTVLAGIAAQDPYAEVVGREFTAEPYGLGMARSHPEFVRFVNSVLEQWRTDGRWLAAYDKWLRQGLGPPPPIPKPVYGRNP